MFALPGAANMGTLWWVLARSVRHIHVKRFGWEANKLQDELSMACWNFQLKMENVMAH